MRKYKNAVVTGASSGLGVSFARQLASEGVNLILVARRLELLENLAQELRQQFKVEVQVLSLDLTHEDAAEKLFSFATAGSKNIDLLINNAGNGAYRNFLQTELSDHLKTLELNTTSLTRLTHYFAHHMLAHGEPSSILNVSSLASYQAIPKFALYCGSKTYVRVFSEILGTELRDTSVNVSCLCPGGVATDFLTSNNQKLKTRLPVLQTSDEVVRAGLKGVRIKKSIIIPGFLNNLQVFLLRFLPREQAIRIAQFGMSLAIGEAEPVVRKF